MRSRDASEAKRGGNAMVNKSAMRTVIEGYVVDRVNGSSRGAKQAQTQCPR